MIENNADSLREQVMISQFEMATGCTKEQSRQLLIAARWEFEMALSIFFQEANVPAASAFHQHRHPPGHLNSVCAPCNTPATPPSFPEALVALQKMQMGDWSSGPATPMLQQQQQPQQQQQMQKVLASYNPMPPPSDRFPQNCDWPSTVEASPKQSSSENMHMMIVPHSGIVSENNTPMAMSPQDMDLKGLLSKYLGGKTTETNEQSSDTNRSNMLANLLAQQQQPASSGDVNNPGGTNQSPVVQAVMRLLEKEKEEEERKKAALTQLLNETVQYLKPTSSDTVGSTSTSFQQTTAGQKSTTDAFHIVQPSAVHNQGTSLSWAQMDDAFGQLQNDGSASYVSRQTIKESFHEKANIGMKRKSSDEDRYDSKRSRDQRDGERGLGESSDKSRERHERSSSDCRRSPPTAYRASSSSQERPRERARECSPPVFQPYSQAPPQSQHFSSKTQSSSSPYKIPIKVASSSMGSKPTYPQTNAVYVRVPRDLALVTPDMETLNYLKVAISNFRRIWRRQYSTDHNWNGFAYNYRAETRAELTRLCRGEDTHAFTTLASYLDNKMAMKIHSGAQRSKQRKNKKRGPGRSRNGDSRRRPPPSSSNNYDCHSGFRADYRPNKQDVQILKEIDELVNAQ